MLLKIKTYITYLLLVFRYVNMGAQFGMTADPVITGIDILRQMHTKYYKAPCKRYTFSQKNTHYRNDSVIGHSVWHEAIEYPDKFRIDRGNKADGNYVIYKNDSAFNYKANKLVKSRADSNSLLLLIGGMFYRDFENAMLRLKNAGYKTAELSERVWIKDPVYVVGTNGRDTLSNQVWIDKNTLYIVRIIQKINPKDVMDMRFESHEPWCNGNVETKVSFRRNGKLEQVEEYYDIKIADSFPDR